MTRLGGDDVARIAARAALAAAREPAALTLPDEAFTPGPDPAPNLARLAAAREPVTQDDRVAAVIDAIEHTIDQNVEGPNGAQFYRVLGERILAARGGRVLAARPSVPSVTAEQVRRARDAADAAWHEWNDWPGSARVVDVVLAALGIEVQP